MPIIKIPFQRQQPGHPLQSLYQFVNLSMRNYSFSNIANQETYTAPSRRTNDFSHLYRHNDHKPTDSLRPDDNRKKYDTPTRADTLRQAKDYELRQELKEDSREARRSLLPNSLKESFAVNRIQKNSYKLEADVKDIVREREARRPIDKENDYAAARRGSREEEVVIVSKVREMKESIVNHDYSRPSPIPSQPTRSSVPSFTKHSTYADRFEGRREFEPRVENIDKINSKIKQILSCLSDNDRQQQIFRDTKVTPRDEPNRSQDSAYFGYKTRDGSDSKRQYDSIFNKESENNNHLISTDKVLPESSSQIISKHEPYASKPPIDSQRLKTKDYSVSRSELFPKESSVTNPKPEDDYIKTPTYPNKDEVFRSRSQIGSNRREADSVLKSGKKVGDEITRIQKKIEEFEQEKRKLNIEFTPFTLKNKSTANLTYSAKPEKTNEPAKHAQDPTRFTPSQRASSNDLKFRNYLNRAADYSQKYGNLATSNNSIIAEPKLKSTLQQDFELKIQQIEVKNIQPHEKAPEKTEQKTGCPEVSSSFDGEALKRRTDEGIEERRRRRQGDGKDIISTGTLKSIVSLFCEQVKLDENLRNLKIWLEACPESDKPAKISKALEPLGIQIPPEQCKSIFAVDESENNPFFSVQGFSGNFGTLAQAYQQAQEHWRGRIQGKFERAALVGEGFSAQKIDLERKGFIELEDLVRFLNIESGTFFRNRDLFLIFRRLTPSDRVDFEAVLAEVCAA